MALLALVPLLLAIVWLGKVVGLRQSVIQASRLVAFECTVRLPVCDHPEGAALLAREARARVFAPTDAPVRSPVADYGPLDPFLARGSGRAGATAPEAVSVNIAARRFDAGLNVALARPADDLPPLAWLSAVAGPARFGHEITDGLRVATVKASLPLAGGPWRDTVRVSLSADTAVLSGAWQAIGPRGAHPDHLENRVRSGAQLHAVYETAVGLRYAPVLGLLSLMGGIGLEPRAGGFRHGVFDVDVVPLDRIGSAP
ncbi:MAG: hypothetical protein KGQ67_00605 [Betaproteobacteria bacterium]|nr:hypothetical protein [Betaproteobacteria bacterium]